MPQGRGQNAPNIQESHLMTKEHLIESQIARFNRKKDIPSLLKCSKLL